jgi:hypothetical protein
MHEFCHGSCIFVTNFESEGPATKVAGFTVRSNVARGSHGVAGKQILLIIGKKGRFWAEQLYWISGSTVGIDRSALLAVYQFSPQAREKEPSIRFDD